MEKKFSKSTAERKKEDVEAISRRWLDKFSVLRRHERDEGQIANGLSEIVTGAEIAEESADAMITEILLHQFSLKDERVFGTAFKDAMLGMAGGFKRTWKYFMDAAKKEKLVK